jgi:hypothetical protein
MHSDAMQAIQQHMKHHNMMHRSIDSVVPYDWCGGCRLRTLLGSSPNRYSQLNVRFLLYNRPPSLRAKWYSFDTSGYQQPHPIP